MVAAHTDIDIDVPNRNLVLKLLPHVAASMVERDELRPHPNGVYFHDVPTDPVSGLCSIPYGPAEEAGFFKIDFLNVHLYSGVRDEAHLIDLMSREPMWELLQDEDFVTGQKIWQVHNRPDVLRIMKPTTIEQLAMVIAMIRPAKIHLIGKPWSVIEREIWIPPTNSDLLKSFFKKAHSVAYAVAIVVQLNLIVEQLSGEQ